MAGSDLSAAQPPRWDGFGEQGSSAPPQWKTRVESSPGPGRGGSSFIEHPMVRPNAIEDRPYQRRIVDQCLEGNTLVVLPTALGKTVVAELVAAELLHRHPGCRVLVMAPTRPLAQQHMESFLRHLRIEPHEAALVTGETGARGAVWRSPRVRCVFATPQAVWNDYRRGLVRLEEFALLVFDECHRSRSRYAYTRLASEYVRRCPWPRILALTASPGSEEDKVLEVVRNLAIERVVWRTEEDEEVSPYIPGVKVGWVRVRLPQAYEAIRAHVRRMVESMVKQLQCHGFLGSHAGHINRKAIVQLMARLRAEINSGVRGHNMHLMALCSEILSVYHALELIESQHVYSLRQYLREVQRSRLRSHAMLSRRPEFRELVSMAERCDSDHSKVEALLALVDQHLRETGGERVMVFANIRNTAEVLVQRLRERGFAARLFIGKGEGRLGPRMSQEEQRGVLEDFRRGRFNVLVATSIGEEGLDIPECRSVIFYEPAVSGIRYIQRRGRTGRRLPGRVTILLAEGTVDEYYFREGFRRARKMAKILESVSKKVEGTRIERGGVEPRPGEPWPWIRRGGGEVAVDIEQMDDEVIAVPTGEGIAGAEPPLNDVEGAGLSFKDIHYCSRHAYKHLLRAGARGATIAELMEALDGYESRIVRAAVNRLVKRRIAVRSGDRYYASSVLRSGARRVQGDIYTVEIEKIYRGFAVVIVNDRFRARLDPNMYWGPREYIKKGTVLRVRASIFREEGGPTSIIIHDVVGLM